MSRSCHSLSKQHGSALKFGRPPPVLITKIAFRQDRGGDLAGFLLRRVLAAGLEGEVIQKVVSRGCQNRSCFDLQKLPLLQ